MSNQELPYERAALLRFLLGVQAFFMDLPRWLLLAAVIYAPWAYGCTRWWTKTLLIQSLLAIGLLWVCSLFLRRRWPRVTTSAGVVALTLLGLGWLSTLNAVSTYDELMQVFSPVSQLLPGLFGTWDAAFSHRTMLLVTALMAAFFISMDLAANPVWRRRLFLTFALSGGLLLLFGLVERATGAQGIFWDTSARKSTFFATYFYHANAGAFINLTLPLVAGQAILAFRNEKAQLGRAFWGFLLLVTITSVFVNTSRASMAIGILIMAVLAVGGTLVAIKRHRKMFVTPRVLATGGVVFACAVILTLGFGVEPSLGRWNETLNSLFASEGALWEGRVSMYRSCWLALPSAGWFGFGPGTFSIMFPFLELKQGRELDYIVRYAHQDYLQTALEWGAIGFTLWAILIGGGVARAFRRFLTNPQSMTSEHGMWIALSTLSLIGVLIHSLVDFPLQIASLQLITAVLLGQLWASFSRKDRPRQEQMTLSNRSPRLKRNQPTSTLRT
jgi:O-antigen ligase